MSDIAIRCEGLSKQYRIGQPERYKALRDVITDAAAAPFRRLGSAISNGNKATASSLRNPKSETPNSIWALDDVSFEVKRGEVVGIIGRNGAGKSTLLKILSRITEPTRGHAEIQGRVGSLLEVGTGFHPELTGRENIYLNAAILGMRRLEVQRKFDEIVAFAEIEKFIDTPVKRYSSGMYVRLAFAVAAHMDTDVLLVDEVLAVGDAQFQKKCLGKMEEVSKCGRTILLVSHQMATVQNLCDQGILLSQGLVAREGKISEVVRHYLMESNSMATLTFADRTDRRGSGALRFTGIALKDDCGEQVKGFACGGPAVLELSFLNSNGRNLRNVRIGLGVDNDLGQRIAVFSTHLADQDFPELPSNIDSVELRIPRMTLVEGRYSFTLFSSVNGEVADWIEQAGTFEVEGGDFFGSGQMPGQQRGWGCVVVEHEFSLGLLTPANASHRRAESVA
ncbi:MAG: ABC transporter ATP-binding protein [bacterium]